MFRISTRPRGSETAVFLPRLESKDDSRPGKLVVVDGKCCEWIAKDHRLCFIMCFISDLSYPMNLGRCSIPVFSRALFLCTAALVTVNATYCSIRYSLYCAKFYVSSTHTILRHRTKNSHSRSPLLDIHPFISAEARHSSSIHLHVPGISLLGVP